MSKILSTEIDHDLDVWPRNPINNPKFENGLFEATSIVKNNDKETYLYSGYLTTFNSAGSWNFDNDTNIISIFMLIIVHHVNLN